MDSVALRSKPSLPFLKQLIYVWSWTLVLHGWNAGNVKDHPHPPLSLLAVLSTCKQMEQAPGWAEEGPPVLPLQGREAECEECQRRENKSILHLFLSIWRSHCPWYLSCFSFPFPWLNFLLSVIQIFWVTSFNPLLENWSPLWHVHTFPTRNWPKSDKMNLFVLQFLKTQICIVFCWLK